MCFSQTGAILTLLPKIETDDSSFDEVFTENTLNTFQIEVIATAGANSRSVLQLDPDNPVPIWDLIFTLEKTLTGDGDCDVIEEATMVTFSTNQDEQELNLDNGQSTITFNDVVVVFDLTANDGPGNGNGHDNPVTAPPTATTCAEFDKLCVEIQQDTGGGAPLFTFAGSGSVNTDGNSPGPATYNPKKCIDIPTPQHCKGKSELNLFMCQVFHFVFYFDENIPYLTSTLLHLTSPHLNLPHLTSTHPTPQHPIAFC